MSSNQPTLFGAYEWGQTTGDAPTLFASGFVPQTYSLSLSETVADTDAELFSTIKVLNETVTLTESQAKTLRHLLADSVTPSVAIMNTLTKVLAESASITDNGTLVFTVKNLTDFLVLKEWIAIRLTKNINWVNPIANANTVDTLWARSNGGPVLWAGKNVLFGGVKPTSSWTRGTRGPSVWTNSDGAKYNY